ncbi:MAG: class I SAM-dependent methyltransferase [Bacteroidota bacterium]
MRHRKIFKTLLNLGIQKTDAILEIGCGIGTVSSLILPYNPKGHYTAVDISPDSIALAKQHLSHFKHASFVVSDMSDFKSEWRYNWMVLPDVLEHIPVSLHPMVFKTLQAHAAPHCRILIHIPHPERIRWLHQHQAQSLQIIDQDLNIVELIQALQSCGFEMSYFNEYALHHKPYDYITMVFRLQTQEVPFKLKSTWRRAWENWLSKW